MSKGGIVGRFFRAIWTGVDGIRKVLHLLLLLFIFSLVIAALSASVPKLPAQAALVIRPTGALVDQLEGDPFDRAVAEAFGDARPETLVQDIVDGLAFAKDDPRIKGVVIYLDGLAGGGLAKLQRVAQALADFRESGKPVIAAADNYGQDAYYIAAYADQVYMHPEGLLLLQGYGVWLNYFKDAIDKLKIDWNVFRVGTYKSAVEPFTRNSMSDADRTAMTRLTDALWSAYSDDVSAARGLEPGVIDDLLSRIVEHVRSENGSIAQVALKLGLVDELLTHEEVGERVAEYAGADPDDIDYYNAAPLAQYLAQMRAVRGEVPGKQNVAIVVAAGEILDGTQPPGTIGGDSTAELLRRAKHDDSVKAVVLRVDSPGGSAFASEIIRNEILSIEKAGKPVVASMSSVAASGGYWISMAADRIYASPTTITGSIGIFGMFPTVQRSLSALGISTDGVGTTPWAGQLRLDRALSDDARALIQAIIEDGYHDFVSRVALHRDMPEEAVDRVGQGQVWTGAKAAELGLVDELGGLEDAVAAAAELAGLEEGQYGRVWFERELTPAEQLVLELIGTARAVGIDPGGLVREPSAVERIADTVLSAMSPLLRFNDPNGVYAYCFFCAAQ